MKEQLNGLYYLISSQWLHHNGPGTFLFHRRSDSVLASIIMFLCSTLSQYPFKIFSGANN